MRFSSILPARAWFACGIIATCVIGTAPAAPPAPQLTSALATEEGVHQSTNGVVDLKWEMDGGKAESLRFELQEATPASPDSYGPRYKGPQKSSVRTGLAEGRHQFRIRALPEDGEPGPWSEPLAVQVTYMDRGHLILLLALGGSVVIATISVILYGHFSNRDTLSDS